MQLDEDFRDELKKTIETLLAPENLTPKKIAGIELRVEEFLPYMKNYFKFFATKDIPRVANLFENIIKVELDQLIERCLEFYNGNVAHLTSSIKKKDKILEVHEKLKSVVIKNIFKYNKKLGTEDQIKTYEKLLEDKIEEAYKIWSEKKLIELEKEEIQRQHEVKLKELKKRDEEKKQLEEKVESLKSELSNARVTRSVESCNKFEGSSFFNEVKKLITNKYFYYFYFIKL
jgi:hypothetical protein